MHPGGIYPAKVIEIITREKEQGVEKDVIVIVPKGKDDLEQDDINQTRMMSKKLTELGNEENIFIDVDKLKEKMLQNANNAINNMVEKTLKFCENNFQMDVISFEAKKNEKKVSKGTQGE